MSIYVIDNNNNNDNKYNIYCAGPGFGSAIILNFNL